MDEFIDLSLGFHLRDGDLLDFDAASLLAQGGDWEAVAAVNLLCRKGDFSRLESLTSILDRSDDTEIWDAIVNIVGFAGSWETIYRSFRRFDGRLDELDVRYNMAVMLGCSCNVHAIGPLLDLYRISDPTDDSADQILRELSDLLEPANQNIFYSRHRLPSPEDVYDLVMNRLQSLKLHNKAIFEGDVLDVNMLARRLLERLHATELQRERFSRGKLVFEAATGVNCSSFFDEMGRLDRLLAIGVLEDFLEGDSQKFSTGQRYFFGHLIPD